MPDFNRTGESLEHRTSRDGSRRITTTPVVDRIAYQVVSKFGGIDGRDWQDKGGQVEFASFDRSEAEAKLNPWTELKLVAVSASEFVEMQKAAKQKLDGMELLLLEIPISVRALV